VETSLLSRCLAADDDDDWPAPELMWEVPTYQLKKLREIVKEGVNKSNYSVQNPLLLVMKP
jgi:hypothetical protein